MAKVTGRYFTDKERQNEYAPGLNTASREVRERNEREERERWQRYLQEQSRQHQEMADVLNGPARRAMDAGNEEWERQKESLTASAARTARAIFARKMEKVTHTIKSPKL